MQAKTYLCGHLQKMVAIGNVVVQKVHCESANQIKGEICRPCKKNQTQRHASDIIIIQKSKSTKILKAQNFL